MKNSILFKIDSFIFKQLDNLKELPIYAKFQENLSGLDDDVKKHLYTFLASLVILIPLLIILFIYFSNLSLSNLREQKKEILTISEDILNINRELRTTGSILPSIPINSLNDFNNLIKRIATQESLKLDNINLSDINTSEVSETIQKTDVNLNFKEFTNQAIVSLFTGLHSSNVKISSAIINRNDVNNKLEGVLKLIYFSRLKQENMETDDGQ